MQKKKIKIFILEDLATDQELIKRQVLKFNPHAITVVANDKDSFHQKISWLEPDIILSDYNLPGVAGIEVLLYAKQNFPNIPFVYVTGTLDSEEMAAQAILKGADGYVLKRNLDALPEVLTEVMAKNEKRRNAEMAQQELKRQNKLAIQKLKAKIELLQEKPVREELLKTLDEIKL